MSSENEKKNSRAYPKSIGRFNSYFFVLLRPRNDPNLEPI